MILSRSQISNKSVRLFRALGDETRVRILERLREGEHSVCALTEAFGTGQSRLSFHLRVLKDVGLVTDRVSGRWVYYAINLNTIQEVGEIISQLKKSQAATLQTSSRTARSSSEA